MQLFDFLAFFIVSVAWFVVLFVVVARKERQRARAMRHFARLIKQVTPPDNIDIPACWRRHGTHS